MLSKLAITSTNGKRPVATMGAGRKRSKPVPTAELAGTEADGYEDSCFRGKIKDGWLHRDLTHPKISSKGLVVLAVDVTVSMGDIKEVLSKGLAALVKTLSFISNGLHFAVVFYSDYDIYWKSKVVWSPFTLNWSGEKIAQNIEGVRLSGGGINGCEAFDVALNYILQDIVPVYKALLNEDCADASTIVLNFTDEDMRVYSPHGNLYGKAVACKYGQRRQQQQEEQQHHYSIVEDAELECSRSRRETEALWGKMTSNEEFRDMCFKADVFVRTFMFGSTNSCNGYKDLCKGSHDRLQLFGILPPPGLTRLDGINLVGFACKMIERMFRTMTNSLSSSHMLMTNQQVINKHRISVQNLSSHIDTLKTEAKEKVSEAQIDDLKERIIDLDDRSGSEELFVRDTANCNGICYVYMMDNSTGENSKKIFLSSAVDGHTFADSGRDGRTYTVVDNNLEGGVLREFGGHLSSILSKVLPNVSFTDLVSFSEKETGVTRKDCCKMCSNMKTNDEYTELLAKLAVARYFAIKFLKELPSNSEMVNCCRGIPDVVGAIYAFVCSMSTKCTRIAGILSSFMSSVTDDRQFTQMVKDAKHINDKNYDFVTKVNDAISKADKEKPEWIKGVKMWMYLDGLDELQKKAERSIHSATSGNVDEYKRFEHQECFDLVKTTVKEHLRISRHLPEAVIRRALATKGISSDVLLALPISEGGGGGASNDDEDCHGDDDDVAIPMELTMPHIMSMVGKNYSISNPTEISGVKCVAAAASAAEELAQHHVNNGDGDGCDTHRLSFIVQIFKTMSLVYLRDFLNRKKQERGYDVAFTDHSNKLQMFQHLLFGDNEEMRHNLTNWPCLTALQQWAHLLEVPDEFSNCLVAYKLLKTMKNEDIFKNIKKNIVNMLNVAKQDKGVCSQCKNTSIELTELISIRSSSSKFKEDALCVWCFSASEHAKKRSGEIMNALKCNDDGFTVTMAEWNSTTKAVNSSIVEKWNIRVDEKEDTKMHDLISKLTRAKKEDKKEAAKALLTEYMNKCHKDVVVDEKMNDFISKMNDFISKPTNSKKKGDEKEGAKHVKKEEAAKKRREKKKAAEALLKAAKVLLTEYMNKCEKDVMGDKKMNDLVSKLIHAKKKEDKKEAAKTLLTEYMNKGVPVWKNIARHVCSLLFENNMVSSKFFEEVDAAANDDFSTFMVSFDKKEYKCVNLESNLLLKCFSCYEHYKGSWFSPRSSKKRLCPSCRCLAKFPQPLILKIMKQQNKLFQNEAEMIWFMTNANVVKNSGLIIEEKDNDCAETMFKKKKRREFEEFAARKGRSINVGRKERNNKEKEEQEVETKREDEVFEQMLDKISALDYNDRVFIYSNGMIVEDTEKDNIKLVKLYGLTEFAIVDTNRVVDGGDSVIPYKDVSWRDFVLAIKTLLKASSVKELDELWKNLSEFYNSPVSLLWQAAKSLAKVMERKKTREIEVTRKQLDAALVAMSSW
uniref:Wsv465-like protein n=1 Tax=Metopaulias depressus WSSV-like virus TaxID=1675544 RepID=A0A0K0VL59_9VIRU|nr:wsv465-like protein [Metopaulias depressus WSSV-like virus]